MAVEPTGTQPQTRIDRASPTPLYHQLERILRTAIDQGQYEPGDLLPSENEICDQYGVSRSVVRQTMQNLAGAGIIRTERGRGSFVAERKLSERFVQRTTGFYEDLTRMGLAIETKVVRQELADVPLEVRDFLGVDQALRVDRVRSVGGRVLAYVVTYIPEDRCPGLVDHDLSDRSLYAHLEEHYGLRVYSGYRTVEASPADEHVAKHLDVEPGAALLLLRSAGRTEDGRPLEWFDAWHRADRTRFEVEIAPGDEPRPFQQKMIAVSDRAVAEDAEAATVSPRTAPDFVAALRDVQVVAVVRAPRYADGALIANALAAGGVSIVEFTLTGENAFEAIARARADSDALVGAGSVLTPDDARRALDAGAQFIVSPAGVRAVAEAVADVPVVLAGFTPSEVLDAHQLTGGPVKVFPADVGGPGYLRSLAAPMPGIPLVPSGGIGADNAASYLAAGAIAVNAGSSLCPVPAVRDGDADALRARAQELRTAIDRAAG